MEFEAAKMTWQELDDKAKTIGVALIPAGATERHGGHLPMETDSATAFEVSRRVGAKTGAVVFPGLNYGIVEYPAFHGVFLTDTTYTGLVRDVCLGVEALGFKKILFVSGHGPNNACILKVLKELFEQRPKERLFGMVHCMTLINQLMPDFVKGRLIGHSDFRETSIMLAIDGKRVHLQKASTSETIAAPFAGKLTSAGVHLLGLGEGKLNLCHEVDDLEIHGGYGQVQGASQEDGDKILGTLTDFVAEVVDDLRGVELPRICG